MVYYTSSTKITMVTLAVLDLHHASNTIRLRDHHHSRSVQNSVPKQNERSWEHVNVLVTHIAAFFKLLIAKASIPRSWKQAKLSHPQKGASHTARELQNDCNKWHVVYTLRRPVTLHDSGLEHPTQQDLGHTAQFHSTISIRAEAPCNPLHPTTLKACCKENAKRVITDVCCV